MTLFYRRLAAAFLLAAAVPAAADVLSPEAKDKINRAGEPLQRGASKAMNAVSDAFSPDRSQLMKDIRSGLNDADGLIQRAKNANGGAADADKTAAANKLAAARDTLREKYDALRQAGSNATEQTVDEARDAYRNFQDAYFEAAAPYTDARQREEQRVGQAVNAIKKQTSELQSKTAAARPEARNDVRSAVADLSKAQTDLQKKLADLHGAVDHRWTDIRKDIQDDLEKAQQTYLEARAKAAS